MSSNIQPTAQVGVPIRFSASRISRYVTCPLQAKFRYKDKLPDPTGSAASFGKCIHHALEIYNQSGDIEQAVAEFQHVWDHPELVEATPEYWTKGATFDGYLQRGVRVLRAYDEKIKSEQRTVIATEHKFLVPFGDYELFGYVDLIELRRNGNRNELHIVDYKAQPVDTAILTPGGWKRFGDLTPGDPVIGSDGFATKVEGVYPQGQKEIVELTFSDGSVASCSEDHLWTFTDLYKKERTLPVRELKSLRVGWNHRYALPTVDPVVYNQRNELPLDPYLMGILLAEGGMSGNSVMVSTGDSEIVESIKRLLPTGSQLIPAGGCNYRITGLGTWQGQPGRNPVLNTLRELELQGHGTESKFIPSIYLQGSVDERQALLAGLMDGDGSASNRIQYRTSSPSLHRDFLELCRSLGGVPHSSKNRAYYIKDGGTHECLDSYHISPGVPFNPFRLRRKHLSWHPPIHTQKRWLTDIRYTGILTEMQCIRIANSDGLYVTNDFLLTHNTSKKVPKISALPWDIQFTVYAFAASQPEFWLGTEETPAIETLEWERASKMEIRPILYHVETSRPIDCGKRGDADYMRLHRVATEIEKAIKHDVYVPNLSGESCGWCAYHEPCGLPIPETDDQW